MKKVIKLLLGVAIINLLFASCIHEITIDSSLLPGKWQNNNYFECYYADGSAKFWDIDDDITEKEAIPFTWKLDNNILTQYHKTQYGTIIPKVYTVSKLTAFNLVYNDDYGVEHIFERIE